MVLFLPHSSLLNSLYRDVLLQNISLLHCLIRLSFETVNTLGYCLDNGQFTNASLWYLFSENECTFPQETEANLALYKTTSRMKDLLVFLFYNDFPFSKSIRESLLEVLFYLFTHFIWTSGLLKLCQKIIFLYKCTEI